MSDTFTFLLNAVGSLLLIIIGIILIVVIVALAIGIFYFIAECAISALRKLNKWIKRRQK